MKTIRLLAKKAGEIDMLSRVISGLVLAIGIISILVYTPWWALGLVVAIALILGAGEYMKMARPDAPGLDRIMLTVACGLNVLWPLLNQWKPSIHFGVTFAIGFGIISIVRLARPLPIETSLNRLSADAFGYVYLSATFPFVLQLRLFPEGGWLLLFVMAITFSADTGAYFAGRFLGRHKLYPAVSPKKTIEGAIGGMAAAVGVAFLCQSQFPGLAQLSTVDCIVLGVGGSIFAIIGDLVESLMKRAFKVKDSGTLIPGHGGILDRIDGLLFCAPFVAIYLGLVTP